MIRFLVLSLVATSVAAAGFWSPSPESATNNVMRKDGHRVVVIEYDQDGHANTKVLVSPDHDDRKPESVSAAEHKLAAKVSGVVGHAKEKMSDAVGIGWDKVEEGVGKGREKVAEHVQDGAREAKDVFVAAYNKAKESAGEATEKVRDSKEFLKDTVKSAKEDVESNVSQTAQLAKENVQELASKANVGVKEAAKKIDEAPRVAYRFGEKYFFPTGTVSSLMHVVNLLGFSIAYGMCMWVTFVSSNVLAAVLPRQQFGMVQSKIYPVYFRAMAFSIGMALLGHALSHRKKLMSSNAEMLQGFNLLVSLLSTLVNSAYLEPRATKAMFDRMKIEKEEGRGIAGASTRAGEADGVIGTAPSNSTVGASERQKRGGIRSRIMQLKQRLKKLNTYSSIVNSLTLIGLTWHLVYLGQCLHMTC